MSCECLGSDEINKDPNLAIPHGKSVGCVVTRYQKGSTKTQKHCGEPPTRNDNDINNPHSRSRGSDCRILVLLTLVVLLLLCTAGFSGYTFLQDHAQMLLRGQGEGGNLGSDSNLAGGGDKALLVDCVLVNSSLEIQWQTTNERQNSKSGNRGIVGQKAMISVVDFHNENVQVCQKKFNKGSENLITSFQSNACIIAILFITIIEGGFKGKGVFSERGKGCFGIILGHLFPSNYRKSAFRANIYLT